MSSAAPPDPKAKITADWTRETTIRGWRTWQPYQHEGSRETSRLIIQLAQLKPGSHVLDLASGSGDPALDIAHAVGAEGKVVATDMSEGMLSIAREAAEREGLRNMDFKVADMERLPFPDESFDAVTSRFGIMFVPDHLAAMGEMKRVLKPGGRVVLMCWAHWDQPFQAGNVALIKRGLTPTPPSGIGALTPFRFADPADLGEAMRTAGLKNVEARTCTVPWDFPGDASKFWQMWYEMSAPNRLVLDALDEGTRREVTEEVLGVWSKRENGPFLHLGVRVTVGVGEKC